VPHIVAPTKKQDTSDSFARLTPQLSMMCCGKLQKKTAFKNPSFISKL
jgi:hypothetical protein